jgi:hypothetical protein
MAGEMLWATGLPRRQVSFVCPVISIFMGILLRNSVNFMVSEFTGKVNSENVRKKKQF